MGPTTHRFKVKPSQPSFRSVLGSTYVCASASTLHSVLRLRGGIQIFEVMAKKVGVASMGTTDTMLEIFMQLRVPDLRKFSLALGMQYNEALAKKPNAERIASRSRTS